MKGGFVLEILPSRLGGSSSHLVITRKIAEEKAEGSNVAIEHDTWGQWLHDQRRAPSQSQLSYCHSVGRAANGPRIVSGTPELILE